MKTLIEKIQNLSSSPVLVVGDVMLDRYIEGDVERISPEAPIPVLLSRRSSDLVGGAANVASKIAGLGAPARLVGLVGSDEPASVLRSALAASGVDLSFLVDTPRPTTVKSRLIARHQQVLRLDHEDSSPLSDAEQAGLVAAVSSAAQNAAGIVLEDYGKGVLSDVVVQAALRCAAESSIPVVVDPNGRNFARYRGATVLTPNNHEAALAAGLRDSRELAADAGAVIAAQTGSSVAVTLGAEGILLVSPGGDATLVETRPVDVFDVTGAGDAVAAVMCLALAGGEDLLAAARLANVAGAVIVQQFGVGTLSRLDMIRYVGHVMGDASHKVVDRSSAARYAEDARRLGRSVVFTNGCFDLIHAGHVRSLERARSQGDMLIVGVNTDDSVRRLKGPERPVIGQEGRARVLSAMEAVDLVVLFDEDTPLELITAVQPDVLVKGGDYSKEEVVGWDVVESRGGRVYLVPLSSGDSTSSIVSRIRNERTT
ncbi:MAG: D-glycero-beta-D-manno-heptose 1-phosphate adenylyltransferase [Planctomycetes bacterium]|nr:D-glycero-beta-D-manno-heptose 1-phosphate adenylyltransferase [Planctomycetota bacterium]